MTSVSGSSWKLCSALAIALASTLATGSLAAWGANFSTDSACWAGMLRIRSITRRAFIGVTRTCEAFAKAPRTSVSGLGVVIFLSLSAAPRPAVVLDVALEGPRRGELAQLVPDHALGDEHRDVLATVVHGDRVPEHVRDDRRATRPRLDHVLAALVVLVVHLLEQVVVDERALLQTSRHYLDPSALLVRTTTADDQLVARLAAARPALGLAARVHPVGLTRRLALTTAVRVVDRVHGDTADGRTLALPPHAAGLAPVDVALLGVANLADGGAAADVDVADLTGRHAQLGEATLAGHQLDARAGRTGDLRAATGPQLDGVDDRADRDVAQRQVVARLDVGRGAALDRVALLQLRRGDDVALLPVGEVQQRDARGAVRVVLDMRDLRRHAVLVRPAEVDQPVGTLVPAALVPGRHAPVDVAPTATVQRPDQRLLGVVAGDLGEVGDGRAAAARRRRLVLTDGHGSSESSGPIGGPGPSGARAPEELDAVAGGHGDDGALGVLALAHHSALRALPLPLTVDRVDGEDLHVEDLLHSDLDLGLVGVGPDDERVLVLVQEAVALLRDDRGQQDVPGVADAHACSSVWSVTVAGSACAASAGVVTSAAATVRGAWTLGPVSVTASTVASPRSRSVVPSPSMEGMAPGMSGVVRSGSSAELATAEAPFAGPAMYSASAVSVKTTSSATSTS